MEEKLSGIYFLFHHHGSVTEMGSVDEFVKHQYSLCPQWEDEENDLGKWYLPVLDFQKVNETKKGDAVFIEPTDPLLPEGWGVNVIVSDILNDSITGPCFLQPYERKLDYIRKSFLKP